MLSLRPTPCGCLRRNRISSQDEQRTKAKDPRTNNGSDASKAASKSHKLISGEAHLSKHCRSWRIIVEQVTKVESQRRVKQVTINDVFPDTIQESVLGAADSEEVADTEDELDQETFA